MELNFGRTHRAGKCRKGRLGKGTWLGTLAFAGASKQISLMKWAYDVKPIGSETTDILSYVS